MFSINVPLITDQALSLTLRTGDILFVVGANGTGKSSLVHRFYATNFGNSMRVSAHRQTWFSSSSLNLTAQQKRSTEEHIRGQDTNPQARYLDQYSDQRASIALYDLIDAQNVRARSIADAVDNGNIDRALELSRSDAPIKVINELLRFSNLPIKISVRANEEIVASKSDSAPYAAQELSDGERNALLIAAAVLTAKPNTLIIIDEPERHLHRSIISPLLTLLFARRSDCAFVVSTHDVSLPIDNPLSRTLLVRGCNYADKSVTAWDADLVQSQGTIDDALKADILGARRKLLFVEGDSQSLDVPLYSLIFPGVSVLPKSSSTEVEHAVVGVRSSNDFHWVRAWGIVDNDRRTPEDIAQLRAKHVHALTVFSVESIYYHPELQRKLAQRHAAVTGEDPVVLINHARDAALVALRRHVHRLSWRALQKWARDEIFKQLPTKDDISSGKNISISINFATEIQREVVQLEALLREANLKAIIERYPVRETEALDKIASSLGFRNRDQYEGAARTLVAEDAEILAFITGLFGTLPVEMAAA